MPSKNRPGETAQRSGIYQEIGPRAGKHDERTIVKGEPFPPTESRGSHFKMVRPVKNDAGKKPSGK